jgi:heme exporter protein C
VFAIIAGAFVPLNFLAVRLAQQFVHPRVLTLAGGNLPGSMRLTFLISFAGLALLYVTLWKYEMAAKNARMQVRGLRRALLGDDVAGPLGRSAAPS